MARLAMNPTLWFNATVWLFNYLVTRLILDAKNKFLFTCVNFSVVGRAESTPQDSCWILITCHGQAQMTVLGPSIPSKFVTVGRLVGTLRDRSSENVAKHGVTATTKVTFNQESRKEDPRITKLALDD